MYNCQLDRSRFIHTLSLTNLNGQVLTRLWRCPQFRYRPLLDVTKAPFVEQASVLPHVRSHVGTGSRHDVLDWSGGRRIKRGVAPQGQEVTCEGRRGHGEQGAG